MWSRTPAHYRVRVTGSGLDSDVLFNTPCEGPSGSPRLQARHHEKGVTSFVLQSPPPRFKLSLELDGARIFERELTFRPPKPYHRETVYVELPPSVAEVVDGTSREPEAPMGGP
jgi:hypothetical protein